MPKNLRHRTLSGCFPFSTPVGVQIKKVGNGFMVCPVGYDDANGEFYATLENACANGVPKALKLAEKFNKANMRYRIRG